MLQVDWCAKRLDQERLHVGDLLARTPDCVLGHQPVHLEASLVSRLEDTAEAEPAEAIPLTGMQIMPVFLQPGTQVAPPVESDIVGAVFVVQDVEATLTPEIRGDNPATRPSNTTQETKLVSVACAWVPVDFVSPPKQTIRLDQHERKRSTDPCHMWPVFTSCNDQCDLIAARVVRPDVYAPDVSYSARCSACEHRLHGKRSDGSEARTPGRSLGDQVSVDSSSTR